MPRVLVVDESPLARAALALPLRAAGFDVAEAGDAAQAEASLAADPCDVALVDPDLSEGGVRVAGRLHARRALPLVALVAGGAAWGEPFSAAIPRGAHPSSVVLVVQNVLRLPPGEAGAGGAARVPAASAGAGGAASALEDAGVSVDRAMAAHARQQAGVARLGASALRGIETPELLREATVIVTSTLRADISHVLLAEPDGMRVVCASGCPVVPCEGTFLSNPTMGTLALRNPGAVASEDFSRDPRLSPSPHALAAGARSGLAVAIGGVERPAGVVSAHARSPRAWSKDECRFLEAIAHVLALALERRSIEQAHLGQSRVLQSVFDSLAAGVMVADRERRIVLHNRAAGELLGAELAGSKVGENYQLFETDGVTPYDTERTPLGRALRGESVDRELLIVHAGNGAGPRWLAVSARPLPEGRGATIVFSDATAELEAMHALQRSKADLRHLVDRSPNGVLVVGDGTVTYANRAFHLALGHAEAAAVLGRPLQALVSAEEAEPLRAFLGSVATNEGAPRETRFVRADGEIARFELTPAHLEEFEGAPGTLLIVRDVTESRKLEEQLISAQKMEAVGQLARGIAHDFNNIVGALLVNVQLVQEQLREDDPLRYEIEEIRKAGERAAALTHQLLAFSRQQVLQPRLLDVCGVVREMDRLVRRVAGAGVEVAMDLPPSLPAVRADPGQLEQAVLNVAMNARDAMPEGGRLTLLAREVQHPQLGAAVELSIQDTGLGMDEATRARAFEPFFTTKEKGRGTGLGLSTVYGIVRQSGGRIEVFSEPGRGTRVALFFPVVQRGTAAVRPAPGPAPGPAPLPAHAGVVLLVEDDDNVREAVRRVLSKRGFLVHEAVDAGEAFAQAERASRFDLLLLDMMLPDATGIDVAGRVKGKHRDAQVVFMSGYSDHALVRSAEAGGAFFLQKPFTPEILLRKLRDVLGIAS